MAKKNIEVNVDAIKSARSDAVKELNDAMKAQLSKMLTEVEELNGVWEGPNHDTFMETFEAEKLDLDSFNKSAEAFLMAWKKACDAYSTCENEVSQQIS